MTWAAVITLLAFAPRGMSDVLKKRPEQVDAQDVIRMIRCVWFLALAYSLWDRYL